MRRQAKEDRRYKEREQKMAPKPVAAKKMTENLYAALMDDEGEAVVARPTPVAMPVATPTPVVVRSGPSWADMAKKPAVLVPKVEEPSPLTQLKFKTVYYDSKETSNEPLMTDAEREAYKIMMERQASGYFDKSRASWLDLDILDDEEEEEDFQQYDDDEEW
jgi:hypothetical protein